MGTTRKRKAATSPKDEVPNKKARTEARDDTPLFFKKLPPEIRNEIYRLAYDHGDAPAGMKLRTRPILNLRRVPSKTIVDALLVSKAFLHEAITILVRVYHFSLRESVNFDILQSVIKPDLRRQISRLTIDLKKHGYLRVDFRRLQRSLTGLRELHLYGGHNLVIWPLYDRTCTWEVYRAPPLREDWKDKLEKMDIWPQDSSKLQRFREVEAFIRRQVTQPRSDD